jgi:hypothetical protein
MNQIMGADESLRCLFFSGRDSAASVSPPDPCYHEDVEKKTRAGEGWE